MNTGSKQSGFKKVLQLIVAATAAGVTSNQIVGRCPVDGTIAGVTYIPNSAIAGANTNSRTLSVLNKKKDATGVAVAATLPMTNGVNAAAFIEKTIPVSATAADVTVAKGDVLVFQSAFVGTGLADPGGVLVVTVQR